MYEKNVKGITSEPTAPPPPYEPFGTPNQYWPGIATSDEIFEERTVLHRTSSTYLTSVITSNKANIASSMSVPCFNDLNLRDPLVPTYITTGKKRGNVLLINNIKFLSHKNEQKAVKVDGKNVKKLFKSMGFHVDEYIDLKHDAILKKVNKFKDDSSLKEADISIVIIMNHGYIGHNGKATHGGFTQIYGINGKGVPVEKVLNQFSAESCPAMAGKPKLFIFQSCRGHQPELIDTNETPVRKVVRKHADMMVAFTVLPSFYSPRDTVLGSYYIQSLCSVFEKYAKEFDVEQLLQIVENEIRRKDGHLYQQIFIYKSQGFKRCYLNPKRKK